MGFRICFWKQEFIENSRDLVYSYRAIHEFQKWGFIVKFDAVIPARCGSLRLPGVH